MTHFDLIIIGSGAAGLTAAFTALGLKRKVLIVEKDRPGGECTWSGCIPSKALINCANEIQAAKKYSDLTIDTAAIMRSVRKVREAVYQHETPAALIAAGATYVQGEATFESARVVRVNSQRYCAKRIIIATGSRPLVPAIEGLAELPYLTNDNFFEQQDLPKSIIILGGGAIGMELAQAMTRLGVKVSLVEMKAEVLPREEPEMAAMLRRSLTQERVEFHLGCKAVSAGQTDAGIALVVEKAGKTFSLAAEKLLLALGRRVPTAELNLAAAGIETKGGIVVNPQLETTAKGVYACGDCVGPYQLSHMANFQGKIATLNALFPLRRKANYRHVAWTVFTDPEFARAGMTEVEARAAHGDRIRIFHYDLAKQLDRAKTKAGDHGHIKLITLNGRVLGAHILCQRAGELIAEVQVMKTFGLKFGKLQSVIHPYPTYADALRQLAQQVYIDGLINHPLVKMFSRNRKQR